MHKFGSLTQIVLSLVLMCISRVAASKAHPHESMLSPTCRKLANSNEDKTIIKLKGSGIEKTGISYYSKLVAGKVKNKQNAEIAITTGIMKEEKFDPTLGISFNNRAKLETANVVPKMLACDYYQDNSDLKYRIAYEMVESLETKAVRDRVFAGLTPAQALLKLLTGIKNFNDAGFYHNAVRGATITVDAAGVIKMLDTDYMSVKSPTTKCIKKNGRYQDAKSLFSETDFQKDTDDLYTATFIYVLWTHTTVFNDYFKDDTGNDQCALKRDNACVELIARNVAKTVESDFGKINSAFRQSKFKTQQDNWTDSDFNKAYGDLNLATLIDGLLNQHDFALDAGKFLKALDWLSRKSDRMLLV